MAVNLERSQKVFTAEATLAKILPISYETVDQNNISTALELLDQGAKLFIISDHRSTADTTTGFAVAMKSNTGFDGLLRRSVVTIKDSYLKNRLFRIPLSSVMTAGVVSPSMIDYPNATSVNKEALRTIRGLPGGNAVTINPEATRIKEGGMQKARKEIALYWHQDKTNPSSPPDEDIWFMPVAHEGTEQQWPNGPLGAPYYFAWGAYRHKVKFIIGKPFRLTDIMEQLKSYDIPRENSKQMEVDLVMLQVALLHDNYGNPDYMDGYYRDLFDNLLAQGFKIPNA